MASERECLHPTAEKFCQEEEQKAEKGCLIDTIRRLKRNSVQTATGMKDHNFRCGLFCYKASALYARLSAA